MNLKLIEQFSVWEVDLEKKPVGHEQGNRRPFLVISDFNYNQYSKTPIGFILSTSEVKSKNRYTVNVKIKNGIESHANVSQIRTLDESRFIRKTEGPIGRDIVVECISRFLSILIAGNNEKIEDVSRLISDILKPY